MSECDGHFRSSLKCFTQLDLIFYTFNVLSTVHPSASDFSVSEYSNYLTLSFFRIHSKWRQQQQQQMGPLLRVANLFLL
ncbi:hypothetical protein BLOT_016318 [Blomia tropicalis]|nr:hypothetical protein BLOT_016318 [Blomia tropicalis]